jgi:hypothetical protein
LMGVLEGRPRENVNRGFRVMLERQGLLGS